jgi:hypothetical protein
VPLRGSLLALVFDEVGAVVVVVVVVERCGPLFRGADIEPCKLRYGQLVVYQHIKPQSRSGRHDLADVFPPSSMYRKPLLARKGRGNMAEEGS